MDGFHQRVLLSASSPLEDTETFSETFFYGKILGTVAAALCLVYMLLMCTCKDSEHKKQAKDTELQQIPVKTVHQPMVQETENGADSQCKSAEVVRKKVLNIPDRLRSQCLQTSPEPVFPQLRPVSTRMLPVPPTSSPPQRPAVKSVVIGGSHQRAQNSHISSRNIKNTVSTLTDEAEDSGARNHDYDHLGLKPTVKPSDYDGFPVPRRPGRDTVKVEKATESEDGYSEVEEKIYPEVIDVSFKKKDLPESHIKLKHRDEMKDEDPYNQIGESDGTLPASLIHQLKMSQFSHAEDSDEAEFSSSIGMPHRWSETDDLYATVQDDSGGDAREVIETRGAVGGGVHHRMTQALNGLQTDKSTSRDEINLEEYATIHKVKRKTTNEIENNDQPIDDHDINLYSVGPAEPPRLYTVEDSTSSAAPVLAKKKNKYSIVTARESLASLSARKSKNPYETVDLYDNIYSLAYEGTGVVEAPEESEVTRLSPISGTYDEIATSSGSLSPGSNGGNTGPNTSGINNLLTHSLADVRLTRLQMFNTVDSSGQLRTHNSATVSLNQTEGIRGSGDSAGSYVTLKTVASFLSSNNEDKQSTAQNFSENRALSEAENYPDYECL